MQGIHLQQIEMLGYNFGEVKNGVSFCQKSEKSRYNFVIIPNNVFWVLARAEKNGSPTKR